MSEGVDVRRLTPEDNDCLAALYARTGNPYQEEDAPEVAAMRLRALRARETGNHWSALPTEGRKISEAAHRAFWVAVPNANETGEIIGAVGVRLVGDAQTADVDSFEFSNLPLRDEWMKTAHVGEVRRLRVSPEWRRRGVATALMRELISWSTTAGLSSLVLNTTAAQLPALALYRGLSFREIGRSYLDVYELVWMHLTVD
jgi:ribosomal protein S18 acetylase RimI-like enzyme